MTGVLPRLIQVLKVIHGEDDHILHGCALILLKPTWYQRVFLTFPRGVGEAEGSSEFRVRRMAAGILSIRV